MASVDDLLADSVLPADNLVASLQTNAIEFFTDIQDVSRALEYFSFLDTMPMECGSSQVSRLFFDLMIFMTQPK